MSARIKYTNEPIGEPKVIKDFLPTPAELAFRDEDVKITITLSKKSVEFFKSEAAKADTQYQRMIRRLLDAYVEAHAYDESAHRTRSKAKAARAA
jgi:predicted DNA binding CopG/RHH family protein